MFIYNVIEAVLFCFRFRRWRYLQICFNFVKLLIRYDVPLPASAVKLCIKFLNHDALAIRKVHATLNSPHVRESRFRNLYSGFRSPESRFQNPCFGIQIPKSRKWWLVKSKIQLIDFCCGIRNSGLWNPEYSSRSPDSL